MIDSIMEITDKLKDADGYMVTVTVLAKGQLTHSLTTNSFPRVDMLKSIKAVKELVVKDLEGPKAELIEE